jgi:hypothetical protein
VKTHSCSVLLAAADGKATLSNSGMTITCAENTSKWRTCIGKKGVSSGVQVWEVHEILFFFFLFLIFFFICRYFLQVVINQMTSGSMFLGLAQKSTPRENYAGTDTLGYAIYCKEGKRFYQNVRLEKPAFTAEPWVTGDVIKFTLDCDKGTLHIAKNNVDLGLAYDFLPKNTPLYPCVSYYYVGDGVSFRVPQASKPSSSTTTSVTPKSDLVPSFSFSLLFSFLFLHFLVPS